MMTAKEGQELAMGPEWNEAERAGMSLAAWRNAQTKTAPDADGWITHDGSAKRPKGVGKRDEGEFWYSGGEAERGQARIVIWQHVTRYRVTKRAEKRRKAWVVLYSDGRMPFFTNKKHGKREAKQNGGTLYTAKLKEVTE